MSYLYIMIGPAGCGKSTIAHKLADDISGVIVSSDGIRKQLFGSEMEQKDHQKVFDIAHEQISLNLEAGHTVIFDATNLQKVHRAKAIAIGKKYATKVIGIVYDGTLDTCLKQNSKRERKVPEDAINRMYNTLHSVKNRPSIDEGFDILEVMSEFADELDSE